MSACAVDECNYLDKHKADCREGSCKGCLPKQAEPGKQLCAGHISSIAPNLHTIAKYWPQLQSRKDGTSGEQSEIHTAPGSKPPITAGLLDAIRLADNVTSYLTHIALDEWAGKPPSTMDSGQLAKWLAIYHARDIAAIQDDMLAAAVVNDLQHAARIIRYEADPTRIQHIKVPGRCIKTIDGTRCPGLLEAVINNDDDLPLPSVIQCTHDPDHQYRAHQWSMLGKGAA